MIPLKKKALEEEKAILEEQRKQAEQVPLEPFDGKLISIGDLSLVMLPVKPGFYLQGKPGNRDDEAPGYAVITKGFWLGKTEVTQRQWLALMGKDKEADAMYDRLNMGRDPYFPAFDLSYEKALQFCQKLTERERKLKRLPAGYVYTLPTEAQWEYACRAGKTGDYQITNEAAWHKGNSDYEWHPVGKKIPNAWGFFDMHGNVQEWCRDVHANYPAGLRVDYAGPASDGDRVTRGGSLYHDISDARAASRGSHSKGYEVGYLGFRLALCAESTVQSRASIAQPEPTPVKKIESKAPPASSSPKAKPERDVTKARPSPEVAKAEALAKLEPQRLQAEQVRLVPFDGKPIHIPALGITMLPVQPGCFLQGNLLNTSSEKPGYAVITKGFWLGKTEVTQAQWLAVTGVGQQAQIAKARPQNVAMGDNLPVVCVNYEDVMSFCLKLTDSERAAGRLPEGYEYTLPTETQWEYACRAGKTDDSKSDSLAMGWYESNSGGRTHAVAEKKANTWGFHDMQGNVLEWCRDRYYYSAYQEGVRVDPLNKITGLMHYVVRGGSWLMAADQCLPSLRLSEQQSDRNRELGFRVALCTILPKSE